MNDIKLFDYFGWYVDDDDYLYKKLKEENRNMTTEEDSLYFELCKKFLHTKELHYMSVHIMDLNLKHLAISLIKCILSTLIIKLTN